MKAKARKSCSNCGRLQAELDAQKARLAALEVTSHRTADFRRGQRLGKNDHIVNWLKPAKPRSIDQETYDALPEFLNEDIGL